jgi:hypothetical protein
MGRSTVLTIRSDGSKPLNNAYSRPLRRGVLGDLDGRSKEGRLLRKFSQLGRQPSFADTMPAGAHKKVRETHVP